MIVSSSLRHLIHTAQLPGAGEIGRLDDPTALTAVVIGALCALMPMTYRPGRHVVTAVHEAGHAAVALIAGRRLHSVRLHRDTSGETVSVGRSRGVGVVATLAAGYPAPSFVGLGGIWAVRTGHVPEWSIVQLLVLGLLLLLVRNVFGALVALALIAALLGVHHWATATQAATVCLTLSSFLLVAGLRGTAELFSLRRVTNDASLLARATPIPALGWKVALLTLSALALLAAAALLGLTPMGLDAGVGAAREAA